ncbi:PREDICTED: dual specificity protein phosphatase 15 [Chrysochloris asiatica]|uniref:Dual specificity protein phosphatase 15 n=1 Tax=Chrysochloris asiatica TaxID=185453 RepID=A0A9B0T942_CHRAS|nr:PREDICTED: dual specificity protein phosphatase 15 [Chrysochloris asiatica]
MTEGVGGACGSGGSSGGGDSTIISLPGPGTAVTGSGWAKLARAAGAGPPPFLARLQAPGPSQQGSWDSNSFREASWACARTPAPGIMGNGMTKVLPGLYLGNFIDAKDPDQLGRNKITHIISIHESPQPLLQDIAYLRIPVADTPEVPIKKHFKECINFIHCCRLNGGNCLVHCFAGISRSTTIVTAYVMTVTGLGWREVLETIKTNRPIANPNPGFKQQLEEFGWGSSRKLRRQLEERFGESPFRDEEEMRALLPLCKRCRQGSATSAASTAPSSGASEGTLQRLVPRTPRETHRPLPLLARVKQTFSCLPRCLSRKGGK